MVVVTMRHEHKVDRRQALESNARIVHALRPDKGEGRGALGPHRVAQNVHARGLDQYARMADIGNADGFSFDPRRRLVGESAWRTLGPRLAAFAEEAQHVAGLFQGRALRVEEALAVEVIGNRTVIITGESAAGGGTAAKDSGDCGNAQE